MSISVAEERLVPLDPVKFVDPDITAAGEPRAAVDFVALRTLWFNTGSLCNLTCEHCYIESSPSNDRLVYLSATEVCTYLEEIAALDWPTEEIGFSGGEPFMNPEIITMISDSLGRGLRVLVLTNAMRPMMKLAEPLLALRQRYGRALTLRVSLDHYTPTLHEAERGPHSWAPTLKGLRWLAANDFAINVAGRTLWGGNGEQLRRGYAAIFAEHGIPIDACDPAALVIFPEMDARVEVPEITAACWGLLDTDPNTMMCATSRMIVKRKGASAPTVLPCTLLPYDPQFELGERLADADRRVRLNHPHCAKFCVLGGGSCSVAG
jgi:uncharacterized Fe-S cluster-containing radical SAM superfamily protein